MAILKPGQLSPGPYNISGSFSGSFSGDGSNLANLPIPQIETGSFVTTSSFNAFTGSYNTGSFTGSFIGNGSGLTGVISSSFASTASFVRTSQTASYVLNAVSASYAGVANSINDLNQSVFISGSLTVLGGGTFYGSSSFVYITASQLDISASFISVNVFEPAERFGGLKVYDSGSSVATASLAWDSLYNHWVYENVDGATHTGGMLLSGPRNTGSLGDEPNLTKWFIPRSDGGGHLDDSQIFSSASIHIITGSLTVTQGVTGSLFGTSSFATNALSASFASTVPASGVIGLNLSQIATGSVTASVSPTQFTVTSGSITELVVRGTGVTMGSATTDIHSITGSALITGSLGVTGSASIRAFTGSSATIFNVRNSANTEDILSVTGDGFLGVNSKQSDNVLNILGTGTLLSQFSNVQKNNAVSFVRDQFGQTLIYITSNDSGQKSHAVIQRGSNQNRLSINATAVGSSQTTSNSEIYLQNHLVITQHDFNVSAKFGNASTMPATSNGQGVLQMLNGVAPSNNITDCFVMYGADRGGIAGKASTHFRAEDGTINVLGDLSGIGTSTPGARLDVRAQGALSTDIAFRVRNSADTADILTVNGDGTQTWLAPANNTLNTIKSGTYNFIQWGNENFHNIAIGYNLSNLFTPTDGYNVLIGGGTSIGSGVSEAIRIGTFGSTTGIGSINIGYASRASGQYTIKIGRHTGASSFGGTNSIHLGRTVSGNDITVDDVFMTYFNSDISSTLIRANGSLGLLGQQAYIYQNGTGALGLTTRMGDGGNTLVVRNHPSVPTLNITDSFQQYSADIVAGNAAPHFRTENGSIIKLYQQSAVTSSQGIADALTNLGFLTGSSTIPGVSFGPFGIANTSGSYTYYTTFSSSIAAATSGQTVEMFADIVETGSVTVTLKNGVNINGNGHTYTLNVANGTNAFSLPSSATCFVFDSVLRILNSSGSLMVLGTNSTLRGNAILYGSGSTTSEYTITTPSTIPANISGFTIIVEGAKNGIFLGNGSFGDNLQIYSNTGIGLWIQDSAQVRNSNIYATNPSTRAVYVQGGLLYSMVYSGGANAGNAIHMQSNNNTTQPRGIYNCDIKSLTGNGVFMDNAMDLEDCKITTYGTNKNALTFDTNAVASYTDVHKCVLRSINGACVDQVLRWVSFTDCYLFAGAGSGITNSFNNSTFNVVRLRDSYVEIAHNSNASHGALLSNSTLHEISDCYFSLTNSGSYALKAQGSTTAKYLQNTFTGSTIAIDPNITQGMINTQDNFGNIII
jgi:hypothetical protein